VIRAVELRKRLGEFELNHVSFEVAEGAYAVLLGPTGCGKTVLLETLVGINRPDEGQVWLDGQDVTDVAPEQRGIGFVYQRSMLFPHLSVRQNVAYGLRYHGVPRSEYGARVGRVATLLGIGHLLERGVGALSGGEMQKVALARALAIEPRVLLFDEPLAALDPPAKEALCAELAALHRQLGMTILHVTHDQDEARVLGRTIGVLRDGRLLQFGPKDEVFDRPNSPFVARFVGTENVFAGEAVAEGTLSRIQLGCGSVRAKTSLTGRVGVCVRPELVSIGPEGSALQAANHIRGKVEAVSDRGALVRYQVATAREAFVVLQTKRDYAASGLAVGQPVTLGFEPAAVHVFPWEDNQDSGGVPCPIGPIGRIGPIGHGSTPCARRAPPHPSYLSYRSYTSYSSPERRCVSTLRARR